MSADHRYLWSTPFVREQLRISGLSEAATFRYFLAIMAFDWLQFTAIAITPSPSIPPWSLASSWLTFAITIGGLLYLYIRNGARNGTQFLQRYFPLSVTVGWKFFVAMFAAMWILGQILAGSSQEVRGWSATAALALLNMCMFWRIGAQLAHLAHTRPTNQGHARQGICNKSV